MGGRSVRSIVAIGALALAGVARAQEQDPWPGPWRVEGTPEWRMVDVNHGAVVVAEPDALSVPRDPADA